METNPNVDPDAPFPHDETTPQATPTENPPPEPAAASAPEIAAEAAAAEALPEPLVEVAAEQPLAPSQPEAPPVDEPEPSQVEEEVSDTVLNVSPEETTVVPEPEVTETPSAGEPQAEPSEAPAAAETEEATIPSEAGQPEQPVQLELEAPQETMTEGEGAQAEASQEGVQDELATLANQALTARLSPADEERATTLLKEALLDGRAGVIRAISALPKLPWVVGVNAVTTVWPELKTVFRSQMLAGLVKTDGDAAKRMRLSLARALFKQDVPIALKIIVGASKEMRDRETGAMSPKHSQIFANVLIGRAKPWIAQVPLADLKPNDADIVVNCALLSAFSLPHAPITQLGIIKWAAEAGRLGKLHQPVIDAAQKSLSRWSGKWQNALRKEVADLPESFTAVLKAAPSKEAPQPAAEGAPQKPAEAGAEERTEASEEIADKGPAPEPDSESEAAEVVGERGVAIEEEADAESAEAKQETAPEQARTEEGAEQGKSKQRPVYESKTVPRKAQQGQPQQPAPQKGGPALKEASVPDLIRQLESQFQSLRSELNTTQSKLRQRDEDLRRAQKKASERASVPIIEGEPTPEELARLNRQLESRNQELQARIEELLADSEARAVSVGAVSGEPVQDLNVQLRTLLGLKLQEDYEDFLALEKESPDIVVQQHYRTVLRHVFEVLTREGVQFEVARHEEVL